MAWKGNIDFPESTKYLIENKVAKLNSNSAKEEWLECLAGLRKYKHYIWNDTSNEPSGLFPSSHWTFLHHAAFHKAPISIIQMMKVDKYPLSLPDAEGRLAVDHVDSSMPQNYKDLLQPVYRVNFLPTELKLIQVNFHAVILDRVEALVEKYNLILPVISVLLEDISKLEEVHFAVPGMYGGFTYWFEFDKTNNNDLIALWSSSSSCIVGNSEQLHKCTADGWTLVKKGSS